MCYHNGIRVSFECRLCTQSFDQINDLIVHKKKNHFKEFNYTACIVFEEKIIINSNDCVDQPAGYGLTPSAPTVQVKLEIPDDSNLNFKQESAETERCILVEPKFEQVIFESKSASAEDAIQFNFKQEIKSKLKPKCKNPSVRLKRLSCKEIQKFTKDAAYRDRHRHRESGREPSFIENNYADINELQYQPTSTRTTTSVNGNDSNSKLRIKFDCKLCRKSFNTDQQLKIHVQICLLYNNKSNLAYCVQCNSFFSNSQDLQVHSAFFHGHSIAVEINEQVNDTAPAPVLGSISKNGHRISKTSIIESDAASNDPTEAFGRLDQLERVPEDANNGCLAEYPETQDQDLTYRNFDVEVERRSNSGDSNPFKCPEPNCPRSFKVQEGLTQHLKRHTGFRLFKCQVPDCGKTFMYEGTLYNHQIVHSDSFPFKCTYPSCDEAFKMKISFFKHLKSHS